MDPMQRLLLAVTKLNNKNKLSTEKKCYGLQGNKEVPSQIRFLSGTSVDVGETLTMQTDINPAFITMYIS